MKNLAAAEAKNEGSKSDVRALLEKQDYYTLQRTLRKRFSCKPYIVNNVMDVWECHLQDVQSLAIHNDKHRYILSVIDVFSKSEYGPRIHEERPFHRFGVSVHIRRRRLSPPPAVL
jgi:hypothetical protein